MGLLSEEDKIELKSIFEERMEKPVEIMVFLDYEKNKEQSEIAKQLVEEIRNLSDKIEVEYVDASENSDILERYNLNLDEYGKRRGPIFVFKDKPNMIFFGLPAGEEFSVFLNDLIMISTGNIEINLKAARIIKKIESPIEILVFVTPTCPYCPIMTSVAHKFAYLNDKIRSIIIEATEFPELSSAYQVLTVPRNVIRHNSKDLLIWDGAISEISFAEKIREALEYIK